ncbi:protein kinase domain-containing protein [Massilia sp. PWRC2]|uniref:protein kinase domain-containing protein n=1 Tax=Massilia sp. PWRC2 TaxID=2804626 RepID=UPI003CE8574A
MLAAGTIITLASHSYRLDAPLASSAYGLVWRAARLPAGPAVALKFVNQAQMVQAVPDQRQRWIDGAHDELAFLRQLAPWDGRHIVRLLDSGVDAGLPVLALELLGGDLGAWVACRRAAGSTVDPLQALVWIGQVNQALAKVHQYGRRHLDLKPSNLLLSRGARDTTLKLADFGTSRALADRAPHPYAGTPHWQAPEQLWAATAGHDGSGYVTCAATDYFTLGALLYYLITGGVPLRFCIDAAQAWRQQHGLANQPAACHTLADDEAALFVRHCDDLPARGAAGHALLLLRTLLAPQPAARPPHALAIARLLAAAMAPARRAREQAIA